MEKQNIIDILQDKDDVKAYELTKEIAAESQMSNKYYGYIDDFVSLLNHERSYTRTRAFILCCCQAKWDNKGKIKEALPRMLELFHDEKPAVVRQCLNATKEIVAYLPELSNIIKDELNTIDLTKYKDSMSPLIQKDINELVEIIN